MEEMNEYMDYMNEWIHLIFIYIFNNVFNDVFIFFNIYLII